MKFIRPAFIFTLFTLFFSIGQPVLALTNQPIDVQAQNILKKAVRPTGLERRGDVKVLVGEFIKAALTLVGIIFFVLMVYAGFLWMTAHGKEEQIETARKIIIAAVIGLAIVVGAYAITNFIVKAAVKGAGA